MYKLDTERIHPARISVEVSDDLKKALNHYIAETGLCTRVIITKLVEKLLDGKVKVTRRGPPLGPRKKPGDKNGLHRDTSKKESLKEIDFGALS